jgi:hypothetical protein
MGDLAEPSPSDRAATLDLAQRIVQSVVDDYAMPLMLSTTTFSGMQREHYVKLTDVESLVFRLAQELVQTRRELEEACGLADANIFTPTYSLNPLDMTASVYRSFSVTLDTSKLFRDRQRIQELRGEGADMILRRSIRTNRWHVVLVTVGRNDLGAGFGFEYDIHINSDPPNRGTSAYLTPAKARELAATLIKAAEIVETRTTPARRSKP